MNDGDELAYWGDNWSDDPVNDGSVNLVDPDFIDISAIPSDAYQLLYSAAAGCRSIFAGFPRSRE